MGEKEYIIQQGVLSYDNYGRFCQCREPATQLAHVIPQREDCIRKYGWRVIQHWTNRIPVCNLSCNAARQIKSGAWERYSIEIMEKIIEENVGNGSLQ